MLEHFLTFWNVFHLKISQVSKEPDIWRKGEKLFPNYRQLIEFLAVDISLHYQQSLLLSSLSMLQITDTALIFTWTYFDRIWNVICAKLQLYFYPQMANKTCFPCTVTFCEICYPPGELFFVSFIETSYQQYIALCCLIFHSCIIETVSHYIIYSSIIFDASLVYFLVILKLSFPLFHI